MPCFRRADKLYILLERTRDSVFISMYMYIPRKPDTHPGLCAIRVGRQFVHQLVY